MVLVDLAFVDGMLLLRNQFKSLYNVVVLLLLSEDLCQYLDI